MGTDLDIKSTSAKTQESLLCSFANLQYIIRKENT